MLIAALLALTGAAAAAVPIAGAPEFSGSAEYQFHYGFEAKEVTGDWLKLRLALEGDIGAWVGYHLDAWASLSTKPEAASKLELGEAYLDASLGPVDVRLGSQLINWGTADGINPTSVVNPRDLLSATDLSVAGAPVPAVAATYYFGSASAVTGVLVLDFVPAAIPGELAQVEPDGKPDSLRDNLEFAVRGETMLGGHNVCVVFLRMAGPACRVAGGHRAARPLSAVRAASETAGCISSAWRPRERLAMPLCGLKGL